MPRIEFPAAADDEAPAATHYVARIGTFILTRKSSTAPIPELYQDVTEALAKDNRVTNMQPGELDTEWSREGVLYPSSSEQSVDALLSGSDHLHSVQFSNAISFSVNVPVKNQPAIHGRVPVSSLYEVAWDGQTAVVMWPAERDDLRNLAGGQIVVNILQAAAGSIGCHLYVQACSPGCQHLFAHSDVFVEHKESVDYEVTLTATDAQTVLLSSEGPNDAVAIVEAAHSAIALSSADFAKVKNVARRILDVEKAARSMSFELIAHDYVTLTRTRGNVGRRIGYALSDAWDAVRGKGRRHKTNSLIASLWLAMAAIETLQQTYREALREYKDSVSIPELYEVDLKADEADVHNIDAQFARAAVEHKSARLDNRGIVLATTIGAVAGAAIAATLGGLLA